MKFRNAVIALAVTFAVMFGGASAASAAVPVKDAVKIVQDRKINVSGEKEREKERSVSPEKERSVTERKI